MAIREPVRECLEKDPADRTPEDIDILLEFTQTFPAFFNMTLATRRALCAGMTTSIYLLGIMAGIDTLHFSSHGIRGGGKGRHHRHERQRGARLVVGHHQRRGADRPSRQWRESDERAQVPEVGRQLRDHADHGEAVPPRRDADVPGMRFNRLFAQNLSQDLSL